MQATINKNLHDKKTTQNRKEEHFYYQYTVIVIESYPLEVIIPIILRLYATKSRVYACMWVNDKENQIHVSGGGYAGGYGYHKASAAAQDAINNAGIILSEDIAGRGDSAIQEALKAIALALGYENVTILTAHA
jgi:hypothetical protein